MGKLRGKYFTRSRTRSKFTFNDKLNKPSFDAIDRNIYDTYRMNGFDENVSYLITLMLSTLRKII